MTISLFGAVVMLGLLSATPGETTVEGAWAAENTVSVEARTVTRSAEPQVRAAVSGTGGGGPRLVVRYIPGCVSATGSAGVAACNTTPCPDGQIRSTRASVVVPAGAATPPLAEWSFDAPGCNPPVADEVVTPIIDGAVMVDVFQGLVAPAISFIQPASGKALVQMPLIVYAQSTLQTWTPDVLGQAVAVRATPAAYSWDFGDGSDPLTTTDPGAPYPDETVSHTYTRTGDFTVALTTRYTGEFSLDGGTTWQAIPGAATVTTPGVAVRVVEARSQLTD